MTTPEQTPSPTMPAEIAVKEGLALRLLTENDAERMQEILQADPSIQTRVTWTHGLKNTGDIKKKIVDMQGYSDRYAIWAGDTIAGYIGLWEDDDGYMDGVPKEGEYGFGYFIDPAFRGQGIAVNAAQALMNTTEVTFDVKSFGVYVEDDNKESQRVLQKLGFQATDQLFEEPVMHVTERRWEKVVG